MKWRQPQVFDEARLVHLSTVVDVVAQTLRRTQLYEREHEIAEQLRAAAVLRERVLRAERDITTTIQHGMRGSADVDDDRIEVAARYRTATQSLIVGGDWYDVVRLGDGTIGLSVGDVVGHGIESATAMGQLRSALVGIAHTTMSPAEALMALESFVATLPEARASTCLYARLDPGTGVVRWARAGHPPLLHVGTDGRGTFLHDAAGPPLAALSGPRARPEGSRQLAVGDLLVAYTDGLVERRRVPIDAGMDRLRQAVERHRSLPLQELCDTVLDELLGRDGHRDDVVILAVRAVARQGSSIRRIVRANSGAGREIRHAVRAWLADVHPHDVADLELAAGEAVANSVEHAYPTDPSGVIELTGTRRGEHIELMVTDHGRWRMPVTSGTRGRGLAIMRAVCDDVTVVLRPAQTTVVLRRQVRLRH